MDDVARLEQIAAQLVGRIRDDAPESNGRWLAAELSNPRDWFQLCFVLAAAVPDDRTWTELTEWHTGVVDPVERRRRQWRESQRKRRAAA